MLYQSADMLMLAGYWTWSPPIQGLHLLSILTMHQYYSDYMLLIVTKLATLLVKYSHL